MVYPVPRLIPETAVIGSSPTEKELNTHTVVITCMYM